MFLELCVTFAVTMTSLNASIPFIAGAVEYRKRMRRIRRQHELSTQPHESFDDQSFLFELHHL